MKPILLVPLIMLFMISACQFENDTKNPFVYKKASLQDFSSYINNKDQKSQEKVILVNSSYPLELTLYQGGQFYYFLENLGDGTGHWQFKEDHLYLYAERDMFVMKFNIHQAEGLSLPVVQFNDRFGPKYLELDEK